MKKLTPLILTLLLAGCAGTTPGPIILDGKIDRQEAAGISLTTDLFLAADPSAARPVYVLSGAILASKDAILSASNPASYLDMLIDREGERLGLQPASVDAFRNLMVLAKGRVRGEIELSGITSYDLANVLIGIVEAVHKSAGYRGV